MGIASGGQTLKIETVNSGAPGASEAAPRSDAPPAPASGDPFARPNSAADPNELKPTAADPTPAAPADPNELKPSADASAASASAPVAPPTQLNEIQPAQPASGTDAAAASSSSTLASDKDISTSKRKKKKGLKKVLSF
jgi:hypothetical protein